jgi:hypothetical protein
VFGKMWSILKPACLGQRAGDVIQHRTPHGVWF